MGTLSAEQIVEIDLDGNLVDGADPPPGERFIHTEIYRARPDVGGIVHTHQTLSTMFGVTERPILPLLHVEAPLVARGIPIYPSPELVHDPERGAAVAAALGDYPLCHLQGHGIVTVAPTVEEATIAAIHLERLARANYIAAQLGTARVIPPDVIDRLAGPMVDYHVRWAYYASLADDPTQSANW
jgi:L-fuculose-phosphate aldolase